MAVTTEHFHNGNNSATSFPYTFPYYKTSDIKVKVGGTLKTESTHYNVTGTNIVFTSGNVPPSGTGNVHIYRETDVDTSKATFAAGSSIRATDLNNNETQLLYHAQEQNFNKIQTADIEDGGITSSKILDGTIATADIADGAITSAKLAANSIDAGDLAPNSVGSSELADNSVDTAAIIDDAVTSAKIATGAVVADGLASNAVTTAKLATGAVTTDEIGSNAITEPKIADDAVTNAQIANDAVRTAHILDANITTNKIANDAVTVDKLADNSVDSQHYVDGSIETAHIADNAITAAKFGNNTVTNAKMADDSVGTAEIVDGNVSTAKLANNAVTSVKILDEAVTTAKIDDDAVTSAKLANSINTEIAANTAKVTNATHTGDVTGATSLTIANNAVTTAKIADDAITNAKLADNSVGSAQVQANSITNSEIATATILSGNIADGNIGTAKIADDAVTTAKIADAELTTLAGMQSGTASILADSTALTSTTAELNLLDGKSVVTTVSGSSTDVQLPTAKAVNDAVSGLNLDNGNFVPINDDQSFPNANPDPGDNAGTIVSIADAGGLVVNGSGVSTTGRTLGGSTVTINGIDSSLHSTTIAAGKGMLVQTTSTLNTYDYHRLTLDEAGVASAQTLVSDFNERYRVGASNPSTSLDDGDLFFNTSSNKMLVYNATDSSWDEVQSVGNFFINTISSYSGTGGNSASFNGSAYRFVLSNSGASAEQHIVSVNGVIQKPNSGTSQPSEGFAIDGSSILFSAAPASGSDYFIVTVGAAVNIGTPSDNTVDTDIIQNLAVTQAKLAAEAVNESKLQVSNAPTNGQFLSAQSGNTGGLTWAAIPAGVGGATGVDFNDTVKARFGTGNDLEIYHSGSHSFIKDTGTGALVLNTDTLWLNNSNDTETYLKATENGAVEIRYDNVKKFETTNGGAKVSGNLVVNSGGISLDVDDYKLQFGASDDLQIYHSGAHNYIVGTTTGQDIYIGAEQGEVYIQTDYGAKTAVGCYDDGQVELFYDNSKKFETTSTGIAVSGSVKLYDGNKILCGHGDDLEIFHDGSHSYIADSGTGQLKLTTNQFRVKNAANNESMIDANENGNVELCYDNVKKFETTSDGVTITGSQNRLAGDVRFDNSTNTEKDIYWDESLDRLNFFDHVSATFGNSSDLQIYHNGTNSYINNGTGALAITGDDLNFENAARDEAYIECDNGGAVKLFDNGVKKFETTSTGVKVTGIVHVNDSDKLVCGTGQDLQISHSGTNSVIDNNTGGLYIRNNVASDVGGDIFIQAKSGEDSAKFTHDGSVALRYDNSLKFETISTGVKVSGGDAGGSLIIGDMYWDNGSNAGRDMHWDQSVDRLGFKDNVQAAFGDGNDLQIYHDGSHSYIKDEGTGELKLTSDGNGVVLLKGTSENLARFLVDGACELYHDDSKKFETSAAGINLDNSGGTTGVGKITFGNSGLQYIEAKDSGNFGSGAYVTIGSGTDVAIKAKHDGAVELYYDNTKKFQTEGGNGAARIYGQTIIRAAADNKDIATFTDNGTDSGCNLYCNGVKRIETTTQGAKVAGYLKAFADASDSEFDDGGTEHVVQTSQGGGYALIVEHTDDSDQTGIRVDYTDATPDDNGHPFFMGVDNTATRIKLYASGDIWTSDGGSVNSDRSLKENIVDATSKIEDLKKLKVRNFNFKSEVHPVATQKRLGFIAQEVEEVFPSLVSEHDISNDDNNPVMKKGIKDAWAPILVKALQEAITKIETLETKVAALEAK